VCLPPENSAAIVLRSIPTPTARSQLPGIARTSRRLDSVRSATCKVQSSELPEAIFVNHFMGLSAF
jgi:hypothetical protein